MKRMRCVVVLVGLALVSGGVAEEEAQADAAAQANNPLANMTAFNIQNYYIGDLTGLNNASMNQLWFRYAQPVKIGKGDWLIRASLPVITLKYDLPLGGSFSETGIGDFNIFGAYLLKMKNPAFSVGVGPMMTIPSGSSVSSDKWSAGLAHVLFDGRKKEYQWGYLMTWQQSFAGSGLDDVNLATFQPFLMYQLGKGNYLRTAANWMFNLDANAYSIPLSLGVGKVFKKGNTVYNAFVEPQFTVVDKGAMQPEWQLFFGLNLQFL
ncbi:MAG: hypothetical protein ABFR47_06830 [Verrucomicrobiota bacterium]